MREFSTPMSVAVPATGNLTDDVVRNATEAPSRGASAAGPGRRGLARRHRGPVPRRGARSRQGAGRSRGRTGRPGRPHLADPLRVDAVRLRDLVRRCASASRSTRPRPPSSSAGSCATPAPAPWWPRAPSHLSRIAEVRADLHELRPRLVDRRQRRRRAHPPRRRHLRCRARVAAHHRDAARPGHDHLHLGHHRPPQGLHAHPRQLHDRARRSPSHELDELFAPDEADGASTLLFLPLAHVFARDHPGRCGAGPGPSGPRRRRHEPRPRPRPVPADVRARRAAGLREGLQHRLAERHRRGPRQDLRPRSRGGDRLVAGHGPLRGTRKGKPSLGRARPARGVLTAGLRPSPRRPRRPVRLRHLGWRPARRAARPLLPRHRPGRPGGLRPDRDHRRRHGQHPRRHQDRHGGPPAARHRRSGSPTTGSCSSTAARSSPVTGRTSPRPPRCSSGTAGSTPATSARSTTRASSAITGRKKEILVTAGGKNVAPAVLEDRAARPPAGRPVHGRRRRPTLHRRPAHPRPRSRPGLGRAAGQDASTWPRSPTTPTCARRSTKQSRRPTRPSPRPSRSASTPCSRSSGPRRVASSPPASSSSATW